MDRDHLCTGCTASVVDHAVVCPFLGVIAAGRHKRIMRMASNDALQYVSFQSTANKRQLIALRSRYWQGQEYDGMLPTKADSLGTLYYARLQRSGESATTAGLTAVVVDKGTEPKTRATGGTGRRDRHPVKGLGTHHVMDGVDSSTQAIRETNTGENRLRPVPRRRGVVS